MTAPSDPTAPGAPADAAPVLELRDVHAGYGPFRALFGVELHVPAGGAVALLGANGAGKTSVARVATGLIAPTRGSVHVEGVDLTGKRTFRFAEAGVFHAPEGRSVFGTLSVEENLKLTRRGVDPAVLDEAFERFPKLAERRNQLAGSMSGGEQRMLALAAAIVDRPALLVADELSLGLAPIIVDQVYEWLAEVRAAGTALLIVEQQVHHALGLCDEVAVLRRGSVAWRGSAADAPDAVDDLLGPAHEASSRPR